MKCPVCQNVTLLMSEKQGVSIDYCPECRGIWLDRGELDKIIEKEKNYIKENNQKYDDYKDSHDYSKHKNSKYNHKKKKESVFGDIFDIFGD